MLDRNINSIIYQSYIKLGELGLEISKNSEKGLEGTAFQTKLWNQAIMLDTYLDQILDHIEIKNNSVYRIIGITDLEMNNLLSCLKGVANINDFPIASFIPTKDITNISVGGGSGSQGTPGINGVSSYIAIVFASDNIGTGLSTTPNPSLPFIAFKTSTAPIPITPSSFTGLWVDFIGDNGTPGTNGSNGVGSFTYIRFAADTSGTDFSATPSLTRPYIAHITGNIDYAGAPPSALFNGLWVKFIGEAGTNGTNGTNGKTILITSGPPDNSIGTDGDIAIDSTNWLLYAPKALGSWPTGVSLIGPVGATGVTGAAGTNGTNGIDGVNAYIYLAYADSIVGSGYILVTSNDVTAGLTPFSSTKEYIATIVSTTQIGGTIAQANFNGLWAKYRGDGDRWSTTSATSVTIGTGNKVFIVGMGLAYVTGQRVVAALSGTPTQRVEGYVVSYNALTGQISIDVDSIAGAGTYNVWDVSLQASLPNTTEFPFSNTDVDLAAPEDVDNFASSLATRVEWEYEISKGANSRGGVITAVRNSTTVSATNEYTTDIGTIDLTLDVDINAGNWRLRATTTSNDWTVKGLRRIIAV